MDDALRCVGEESVSSCMVVKEGKGNAAEVEAEVKRGGNIRVHHD